MPKKASKKSAKPTLTPRQVAARKAAETRAREKALVESFKRGDINTARAFRASTLRPGLLVSLKTSVTGNVQYTRRDIETDHLTKTGAKLAKWETERTIVDPVEYEAATKARSLAASTIRGVCTASAFGLLCPEDSGDRLDAAVKQARAIAESFNASASITRVSVYVIVGRVAADDVEAVRAINSEVRDLLREMESGLQNLDVKAVRDAASKARNLGNMLSPDAAARIQIAIDAARGAAKRIVAAGTQAAQEIDRATIARITEARTAFLDMEEAKEVAAPQAEGRALDLPTDESPAIAPVTAAARKIEVE